MVAVFSLVLYRCSKGSLEGNGKWWVPGMGVLDFPYGYLLFEFFIMLVL